MPPCAAAADADANDDDVSAADGPADADADADADAWRPDAHGFGLNSSECNCIDLKQQTHASASCCRA